MLNLYNTLTRKKEQVKKSSINMYFCGPTLYDYAHIGNFRAYLFADLLRKYLKYLGKKVKFVMNITDVDDKTIKNSQEENISLKKFTKKFEKAFFEDLKSLKIEKADEHPRATEHITEMIDIIKDLLKKKIAYQGEDKSIYYDISKFKNYGSLSKLDIKNLKPGIRVKSDEYEKDEIQDFALWKAYDKEDGDVSWNADFGDFKVKGRPGWHIECSAMSSKCLGKIDIHGGGIDLMFPHHENEIAQSEPVLGKFVNHWVHNEHLQVDGKKMSKSQGNFYTLRDLLKKGYDPIAIRYLLITSHYKSQLNFTLDQLGKSKETINNLNDFVSTVHFVMEKTNVKKENSNINKAIEKAKENFESNMNDDLNVPEAMAAIFELTSTINKEIDSGNADKKSLTNLHNFMKKVNDIFEFKKDSKLLSKEEKNLVKQREDLRKEKKFEEADKIRDQLKEKSVILEDTPYGVKIKKV